MSSNEVASLPSSGMKQTSIGCTGSCFVPPAEQSCAVTVKQSVLDS